MTRHTIIAASLLMLLGGVACADEVEDQLQQGRESYRAGHYQKAVEELKAAQALIQNRINRQYLDLLPPPPQGWQADEGEILSDPVALLGGSSQISRRYVQGDQEVVIEMLTDSPLLSGLSFALKNPEMLTVDRGARLYDYRDYRGVMRTGEGEMELSLVISDRVLIRLVGYNVADPKVLGTFLDAMNFPAIEQALESRSQGDGSARRR
ncbi:MAG: hypothetical protein M3Z21_16475 [Pseudomonadota bacterium]|nr:hypothetical protein [Pseudomonadota bacterium]